MRETKIASQFKKDYKRIKKRHKDMSKINAVMAILMNGGFLPPEYKEHCLSGKKKPRFELV